jgi:hypothetical protein
MPIDLTKPENNMKFGNFPAYMRRLLNLNIDPAYIVFPVMFSVSGTLTVGTNKSWEYLAPVDQSRPPTIIGAFGKVKTAPTGQEIFIDVNKNGSSIFAFSAAARVTIPAAGTTSQETSPGEVVLANLDVLTVDIDQVGSGVAGADLVVVLKVKQLVIYP